MFFANFTLFHFVRKKVREYLLYLILYIVLFTKRKNFGVRKSEMNLKKRAK